MTEPTDQTIHAIDLDAPGDGVHVQTFASLDEMFESMATAEDEALAQLHPLQRELLAKREFYWMRAYPQMNMLIFGHHDLDAWIALEKSLTPEEEMGWHDDWVKQCEDKNLRRGYKSGRCFSVVEPEGELGDTHVAYMLPISKEAFEQAREMGWDCAGRVAPDTPLGRDMARLAEAMG